MSGLWGQQPGAASGRFTSSLRPSDSCPGPAPQPFRPLSEPGGPGSSAGHPTAHAGHQPRKTVRGRPGRGEKRSAREGRRSRARDTAPAGWRPLLARRLAASQPWDPAGPTSRTRLSRSACVRLTATTRAPAACSAWTVPRPIPAGSAAQ